jgi:hypothetical protein
MKNGEPQQQHFEKAETHLLNLRKLSDYATLISKHDKTVAEILTHQQLSYSNDGRGLDA